MKYLKMLGLAAVAAAALMAFVGAGSASASVLCSTTTDPCTSPWANQTLTFSLASGATAILKETGEEGSTLDTCKKSSTSGSLTNGSSTATAGGNSSSLLWEECTWTTTTVSGFLGGLEVHKIAGTSNGTVTSNSEIRVTISIPLFGSCVYGVVAHKDIGTITEGNPATFDPNAVAEKLTGSNFACPSTSNWSSSGGGYTQTAPANTTLSVAAS